jgi:hypothetical protein
MDGNHRLEEEDLIVLTMADVLIERNIVFGEGKVQQSLVKMVVSATVEVAIADNSPRRRIFRSRDRIFRWEEHRNARPTNISQNLYLPLASKNLTIRKASLLVCESVLIGLFGTRLGGAYSNCPFVTHYNGGNL